MLNIFIKYPNLSEKILENIRSFFGILILYTEYFHSNTYTYTQSIFSILDSRPGCKAFDVMTRVYGNLCC